MFSKRIPVGVKLGGVTGRPRRWADHSWCRSNLFEQILSGMLFPYSRPILGLSSVLNSWNGTGLQRSASHEIAQHLFGMRAFLCIFRLGDRACLMAQFQPEQTLLQRIKACADGGVDFRKTRSPIRGSLGPCRCRLRRMSARFGLLLLH